MLIKLETGDWVDPGEVVGVVVSENPVGGAFAAICTANGAISKITCSTFEEAQAAADRIAAKVNEALKVSVLDITARAVQAARDWFRRTFTASDDPAPPQPPPTPPEPGAVPPVAGPAGPGPRHSEGRS